MTALAALTVAGDRAAWQDLGFAMHADGGIRLRGLELRLDADALAGVAAATAVGEGPAEIDGLRFAWRADAAPPAEEQPNGAGVLDHVVVATGDLPRTVGALQDAGFELRRTRDAGPGARQAFLLAGATIIEVAGPAQATGAPARFWGLAFAAADLDALAARLGDRLGAVRPAVQAGRRIAPLRRAVGMAAPIVFLSSGTR